MGGTGPHGRQGKGRWGRPPISGPCHRRLLHQGPHLLRVFLALRCCPERRVRSTWAPLPGLLSPELAHSSLEGDLESLAVPRGQVPAAQGEHFQGLQEWPSMNGPGLLVCGPPPARGPSSLLLPGVPPFSHRSGAAGDTVAVPGFRAGCAWVVCSRWGPSPSLSAPAACGTRGWWSAHKHPGPAASNCGPGLGSSGPGSSRWKGLALSPLRQPLTSLLLPLCPRPISGPNASAPPRPLSVKTLRKDKELHHLGPGS